jgi:hypothetical protein
MEDGKFETYWTNVKLTISSLSSSLSLPVQINAKNNKIKSSKEKGDENDESVKSLIAWSDTMED